MKSGIRTLGLLLFVTSVAFAIGPSGSPPSPVYAQPTAPTGIVAFVGTDGLENSDIFILDLASRRIGRLEAPVSSNADLAWQPSGDLLAFTTEDGGYGLLRSLRGCFDPGGVCTDVVYIIPPFMITELEWMPDGSMLLFLTDDGMKIAAPRTARPADITDLNATCDSGFKVAPAPLFLLCAASDPAGNVGVGVYEPALPGGAVTDLSLSHTIGTFPQITTMDIGAEGQAAVGTLESGGDSGFYADPDGASRRLSNLQVHVYALAFRPAADQIAVAGAMADSTGDGTLRDGDLAELSLYDTTAGILTQIPGFTGATALAWSPDGNHLLVILEGVGFALYTPFSNTTTPLPVPLPGLEVHSPAWHESADSVLPGVPTATPFGPPATTMPVATMTPFPTFTPFPTLTPFPTFTPFPSATPGSPMGTGCQFALPTEPVAIGDTAEVTNLGGGLRLRAAPALTAQQIRELPRSTRMTILSGPTCAQGYRWWEARMESDGRTGWVADSELAGYWIQRAAATPTAQPESILFMADRYTIVTGQCVTIWWQVQGIKEVYYRGAGVTGAESRIECPTVTTTYILTVIKLDNSSVNYPITIFVTTY